MATVFAILLFIIWRSQYLIAQANKTTPKEEF